MTFNRAVLEANAPDVRLLTYLAPEFGELMATSGMIAPPLVDGQLEPGPVADVEKAVTAARDGDSATPGSQSAKTL